jgi:hypothetical protein
VFSSSPEKVYLCFVQTQNFNLFVLFPFQVPSEVAPDDEGIEVEYVPEKLDVKDPVYAQFASIFETFKVTLCYKSLYNILNELFLINC